MKLSLSTLKARLGLYLFLLVAGLFCWHRFTRGIEPDSVQFPVRGIDVSHHQGTIDWSRVATAGIHFAFIKATEGRDLLDPRFAFNWAAAERVGVARGAYHYFTFCSPGGAQAEHFLRAAPPTHGALPPAVDIEFVGNCSKWISIAAIRAEIGIFLERIDQAWGSRAIVYVTDDSYERIILGQIEDHPIWIRSVFLEPAPNEYGSWVLWQFSDNGHVAGVEGAVDLNVLRPGMQITDLPGL